MHSGIPVGCFLNLHMLFVHIGLQNHIYNLNLGCPVRISFAASLELYLHALFQLIKGAL